VKIGSASPKVNCKPIRPNVAKEDK
jgi:hypothetical protein